MKRSNTAASGAWHRPTDGEGPTRRASSSKAVSYTVTGSLVVPVLIVFVCPVFAMAFMRVILVHDGDIGRVADELQKQGLFAMIKSSVWPYVLGSRAAWGFILPFAAFQLLLMRIVPGKMTEGPVTPAGNTPVYKANGLLSFFVTLIAFCVSAFVLKLFNPADVYDHFTEIIGTLNLSSLMFCLILCLKGTFVPSSTDSGASGNVIFDYYWGTELYPRILGWDVKMFTNCRFGLMSWAVLLLCYATKQHQEGELSSSMVVSVGLQLIYIAKFFHWEMGYMKSLDIMHDRAGFMLCWGCMVWVPSVYTSHALYLTTHPNHLGLPLTVAIFSLGVISIFLNYDADRQRELTRNTNGDCTIWGKRPDLIRATYHTSEGKERKSLLLVSGWWGVSRHFHYIPELLAAFFWTLPALFASPVPYFYFVFLVILLTHRAMRDDKRCAEKYGKYWDQYCQKVPYKIIPFLF